VGEVLVTRLRSVAWLVGLGALLWVAPAAAVELKGVGSEAPVGANATGEACRIRVVHEDPARGTQRLNLYCDGWTVPSGTLFRFRVSAEATAERLVTDSQFQKGYETLWACNTAGPDGSLGGESLSGLTRAFFYAGARALLASHWAVASGPTVDLTTAMFGAYAREQSLGKAEAVRRAQAALRAMAETSHPFFGAPFVLVGDGGAAGR
jgi:hypothetical protein